MCTNDFILSFMVQKIKPRHLKRGYSWLLLNGLYAMTCAFLLLLSACQELSTSAGKQLTISEDAMNVDVDSSTSPLDSQFIVEVVPLLLKNPATRELDNWYQLKKNWKPAFGSVEAILVRTEDLSKDYLAQGRTSEAAKLLLASGHLHYLTGRYPESTSLNQRAIELSLEARDSSTLASAYGYLALSFLIVKDTTTARAYLVKTMKVARATRNTAAESLGYNIYSGLYDALGKPDSAMAAIRQALVMAKEGNHHQVIVQVSLNLGYILYRKGEYDAAIKVLTQDISLDTVEVSTFNVMLNFNLYEVYAAKEEHDYAFDFLNRGCELSEKMDFGFGMSFCKEQMAAHFERRGELAESIKYLREYYELDQKQLGERVNRDMQSLETKLTISEKNREIEALQQSKLEADVAYLKSRNWTWGAIIGLAGFFIISFTTYSSRNKVKLALQQKAMAETKLRILQSQMKSHFMFNTINGVQNFILKSEKMEAYKYLTKFANLLRAVTKSAATLPIAFSEDLQLVTTYLELEKLRFRDNLHYEIIVMDDLNKEKQDIPSMIIQSIIENAITHWLSEKQERGDLKIVFSRISSGVKCVITGGSVEWTVDRTPKSDEGDKKHLSASIINTEERLAYFSSIGYGNAAMDIEDLHDEEGAVTGTRVTVCLPFLRAE